uniref:Uncharacterized protein n=1 Tax=Arundo donax TaxID=35708 RepID=A0A0A9BG11_ARUDO
MNLEACNFSGCAWAWIWHLRANMAFLFSPNLS